MEIILTAVLVALVAVVVGSGLGFQLHNILSAKSQRAVEEASAQQMRRSNARSKEILLEAKEQALQLRSDAQAQVNDQKLTLQRQQSRLEANKVKYATKCFRKCFRKKQKMFREKNKKMFSRKKTKNVFMSKKQENVLV